LIFIDQTEIDYTIMVQVEGDGLIRPDAGMGWGVNDLGFGSLAQRQRSHAGCACGEGIFIELLLN
jgi:hypothetical protein